ncbi:MAG: GNAT family N-acetyltransferase [Patescibacteria group bacterium]
METTIELYPKNSEEISKFLLEHWSSESIASKGKITDASKISRVIVRNEKGKIIGLATFLINEKDKSCELVSIDALIERKGIGSGLIKSVEKAAKENGCSKVWLVTTNDNYEAAIFYIKNGYRLIEIHKDALDISRKLKPQIPTKGKYGIPMQDEWEFEKSL